MPTQAGTKSQMAKHPPESWGRSIEPGRQRAVTPRGRIRCWALRLFWEQPIWLLLDAVGLLRTARPQAGHGPRFVGMLSDVAARSLLTARPEAVGVRTLPMSLVSVVAAPLGAALSGRFGARRRRLAAPDGLRPQVADWVRFASG